MTDQEFLSTDFDTLLQSMSLDEINARHDAIDTARGAQQYDAEAEYFSFVAATKQPTANARRRCVECWVWLEPCATRCTDCGEMLPIVGSGGAYD